MGRCIMGRDWGKKCRSKGVRKQNETKWFANVIFVTCLNTKPKTCGRPEPNLLQTPIYFNTCLLYTSDAADEEASLDFVGLPVVVDCNTIIASQSRFS